MSFSKEVYAHEKVFYRTAEFIFSFLKRESFPFFVPMRYCVPARTFRDVPDYSALQPFMSVFDRFLTFLRPEKLRNRHGTFRKGEERLKFSNCEERSETFIFYMINGLKRLQNHVHASKTKELLY
jgi:hypothetical protein